MNSIDVHADNYGMSEHSDDDILSLCKDGKLTSVSVVPNMSCFSVSAEKLKRLQGQLKIPLKISVHLNFMEGRSLVAKEKIPHLVDGNGFFTVTWLKLLLWSYNPFLRKKIRTELCEEICAQTDCLINVGLVKNTAVRFDSHQHPHMIPIVFDALMDAIKNKKYQVEFIRNSEDSVLPYFACLSLYKTFSLANMLKCFILNFFANTKIVRDLKNNNLPICNLCGVFFSGNMDYDRLEIALPKILRRAQRQGRKLEILFHPGTVLAEELTDEFTKLGFNEFHLSNERKIEYETVSKLLDII